MVAKLLEAFVILALLAGAVTVIHTLIDMMFGQYGFIYQLQTKFSITTRPQRKTINAWLSEEPYFESLITAYDPITYSDRAPMWTIEESVRPHGRKMFDVPDITIRYTPEPLFVGYRVSKVEPLW